MLAVLDLLHLHITQEVPLEEQHMLELVFYQDLQEILVGVVVHHLLKPEHGDIMDQQRLEL
jgi:hypothetical protein